MFQKLLKYEFKSIGKWYLTLYGVIGFFSIALGFWIQTFILREKSTGDFGTYSAGTNIEGILFGFSMFAFMLLIAALFIATFLLIAFRFKNNVYGRQGYLTMTLPVTSHHILLSKLLSGIIWYAIAGVTLIISGGIIMGIAVLPVLNEVDFSMIQEALGDLFSYSEIYQLLVNYLIEIPTGILCIYFAISLGQLFKDYRTLMSIVFYFAINMGVGIIATIAWLPFIENIVFSPLGVVGPFIYINILIQIGLGVAYYFGTHYIMTKKLNLQ